MRNFNKLSEPSIKAMTHGLWVGLVDALSLMPSWERGVHIFWLLGPFILLIERSPADVWLSVLVIAFVARSIYKRDGEWLRVFWVQACFLFLAVCMLSSAMSAMPSYAFSEGLAWFRFPLICDSNGLLVWHGQTPFICDVGINRAWHVFDDWHFDCGNDHRRAKGRAVILAL